MHSCLLSHSFLVTRASRLPASQGQASQYIHIRAICPNTGQVNIGPLSTYTSGLSATILAKSMLQLPLHRMSALDTASTKDECFGHFMFK